MRRPRSKLQVSTFPFLAVLLCAMGSLLLLLFIMDRRAKIAARNNVAEAYAERAVRTKAEEDARLAEWEKAKEQLHLSLLEQQNQLLDKAKDIERDATDANQQLALVQARHFELQGHVKEEAAKIGTLEGVIALQHATIQDALQDANRKETLTKAELLEAAKELAELERAFQQLKALRERDKQTYSVVPYRGKRGDQRPPIYVECVRDGVLFHPDKKPLHRRDFSAASVRREVENRSGPLAAQKPAKDKGRTPNEEPKGPYVLFLVRPDGIGTYYLAQSSLKGYQVDFGYELVDAGWTLEFSADVDAKNGPVKSGTPLVHAPSGSGFGAPPAPDNPGGTSPGGGGATGGNGGTLLPPLPGGIGGSPFSESPGGPSPGSGNPAGPPRTPPLVGYPSSGGKGPAFVPIGKIVPPVPIASSGIPSGHGGSSANPNGAGDPNKSAGSSLENVSPINAPIPGNSSAGQRPDGGTIGDGSVAPKEPGVRVPGAGADKKQTPATPLSKLLGNKDFIITIECQDDHVTVFPSGLLYRWTADNIQATDQAFVQTITNLIARRQASVRPGEPPYRPLLRFQVSPDGQRTYLHAYPLLEHLHVPWTRENPRE